MKCKITTCVSCEDCAIIEITKKHPKSADDCSYYDDGKKKSKRKRRTNIDTSEE